MDRDLSAIKDNILREFTLREKEFKEDIASRNDASFRRKIEGMLKVILREARITLDDSEREDVISDIVSYFLGLGPIEKLIKDADVSEIMINGKDAVYIEKKGNIELTDIVFNSDEQLDYFIDKIVSPMGRRVTEYTPFVDARLRDGSRVNIVKSPISSIGPVITIRKFSHRILNINELVKLGTLSIQAADFLKACVVARINLLVSGAASSGKSTLLNALGSFIPEKERVITIEDTLELCLGKKHTIPLETRSSNIEGKGEIDISALVKNSLHMRPDRIIIGEVRSGEVLDMIQAMNTGHDGSMSTLHANSALEALDRLEILSLMGADNISSEVAKRQIINTIDLIVHTTRFTDGSRRVTAISEVVKGKDYALAEIFIFKDDPNGKGNLQYTGKAPSFYNKLKQKAGYICKEFEQIG